MKKLLLVLLLISIIIVSGCRSPIIKCDDELSSKPRFLFDEISDYNDLQIKLDFSNKGDIYSLTIFGNKSYHYIRKSPTRREFEGILMDETIPNLIKEFKNKKFNYMKESYYCSQFTDGGFSKITFIFNKKTIIVGAYASDGPEEFYNLKNLLLNILNNTEINNEKQAIY